MSYRVRKVGSDDWTVEPVVVSAEQRPTVPLALPASAVGGWTGSKTVGNGAATLVSDARGARIEAAGRGWRRAGSTTFDEVMAELAAGSELTAASLPLVRRILAIGAPATFGDSLARNHGMVRPTTDAAGDPVEGRFTVDLQPGIRLRIKHQFNQFVAPPSTGTGSLMNGYVSAGDSVAEVVQIVRDGATFLSLDSFLGIVAPEAAAVAPDAPDGQGAGGIVDLTGRGNEFRHLKLLWPATFVGSQSVQSYGPEGRVCIVGAQTKADLELAVDACYVDPEGPVPDISTEPGAPAVGAATGRWFFRGRVTVIPEIPIFIDGRSVHVPLGTTVRQVIGRYFPVPRTPGVLFDGVTVRRTRPGADVGRLGSDADYGRVHFENDQGGSPDAFDLPLLAADRIDLR